MPPSPRTTRPPPRTASCAMALVVLGVAALGVLPGLAAPALGAGPGDAGALGAALYARHCAECHGSGGAGDGPQARSLLATPADLRGLAGRMDLDLVTERIAIGGKVMPGFARELDAAAQQAIARFVLSLPAAP